MGAIYLRAPRQIKEDLLENGFDGQLALFGNGRAKHSHGLAVARFSS
jgi:hypothetical protein